MRRAIARTSVRDALDGAAADGVAEPARALRVELAAGIADQAGAIGPQRVGEQDLGVEPRRVHPGRLERDERRVQRVADGDADRAHSAVAACASRPRRFSSSWSAPVNSSSSPSSTWSRLCAVSFTRWSVTRRSP